MSDSNAGSTMNAGSFTVTTETAGGRLDKALQEQQPHESRSTIQKWIDSGGVRVNGKVARSGSKVAAGDRVEWKAAAAVGPAIPLGEAIPLEILFEDDHLIVLNKQRGLVVHPAAGHSTGTLVNALIGHLGERPAGAVDRPGLVHRLDRDTTGLMVIAKDETALRSLQEQIAARSVERRYLAVVWGSPRWEEAVVDAPIGRHPTDRKKMGVIQPGSDRRHRRALTEFRVLERFASISLLEARLHTGRTHQVRVHCAYVRLPVLGDATYGVRRLSAEGAGSNPQVRLAVDALGGQALHAWKLSFDHPVTGARLSFACPPPSDFGGLLTALHSVWQSTTVAEWKPGDLEGWDDEVVEDAWADPDPEAEE